MENLLEKLPCWLILILGLVAVAVVGIVDYLTGDYSLLIFYAVPVAVIAWFVGRWGAMAISLASGLARAISDYISYKHYGTAVRYWNSLQDMVFLLMVGLLIVLVKKLMAEEQNPPDD